MSPDRERRPSVDGPAAAGPNAAGVGVSLTLAAAAGWLVYAGIYALTFALAGSPIAFAIRAGLANAIPDGLLALATLATPRKLDRGRSAARRLWGLHLSRAVVLVGCAAAGKTLLLWFDVVIVHGGAFRFSASIVAWQVFLSVLIYIAVASMSHAWLIARRLREEEAHAASAEALRARAEMAALRAQLNPHFLLNTLHSVLGLVRRDPALAEAALEKLGDLLHYAIRVHRDGVDWTALRHEWEFMETYLDLETIRLGDRLQVVRRLDDIASDLLVPTFSLQPLVENAVRHGISPRAAGGRISIDARLQPDALRLEVANDGNRGSAAEADEGGLGLRVLRDRLEALYSGRAQMTAGQTAGGYSVVLTLPVTNGETESAE
jgi:sensor histidine kinase YesM